MYFLDDDSFAANFGDEIMTKRTLASLGALRTTQMRRCGMEMSRILNQRKKSSFATAFAVNLKCLCE